MSPPENSSAALERENARLRGDLRTISRRLAHDLRNPLNCISTAAEALRDPSGPVDAMTEGFTQSIASSVEEAEAIVRRLSTVLKATADPVAPQPVMMDTIVAHTLARLGPRLANAGTAVTQPPTWPAAVGVPAWLDLIWENLLLNSVQHAGAQPRIAVGGEVSGGETRFWLRDSGPGIAPEKRARLFHPLERLHEQGAPRGYGLPIVRRLVELQAGQCGYEAGSGPGGVFFFTLPSA